MTPSVVATKTIVQGVSPGKIIEILGIFRAGFDVNRNIVEVAFLSRFLDPLVCFQVLIVLREEILGIPEPSLLSLFLCIAS